MHKHETVHPSNPAYGHPAAERRETWGVILKRLTKWAIYGLTMLAAASMITAQEIQYVVPSHLPPSQRILAAAAGNRLQRPGQERKTITGGLQRYANGQPSSTTSINLVYELPDALWMQFTDTKEIVVFSGAQIRSTAGAPSAVAAALVESLVNDTVEGFLFGQLNGGLAHLDGTGYRIVDPRPGMGLTGTCDLFEFRGPVMSITPRQETSKSFCFDHITHLPTTVTYQRGGVPMETRFGGWQQFNGQNLPTRISRLESNALVFDLTVQSYTLAPKTADGLFVIP